MSDDLRKRIEAGADWWPGQKPQPPRLSVLARFIQETWPELRVTLRDWTTNTDRKIGRIRWPGKGRKGKLLEVRDSKLDRGGLMSSHGLILRHESGDPYRYNSDVCRWIVERLKETKR